MRFHTRYILPCLLLLAALYAILYGKSAAYERPEVDVALVLAIDVSASVSGQRWELQKKGYAEAFRSKEVAQAITQGLLGKTAVTVVLWAGLAQQKQIISWQVVKDKETLESFAHALETMERSLSWGNTCISGAITFSAHLFLDTPFASLRKIIDISGDGGHNEGPSAEYARDAAIIKGITINGLPILGNESGLEEKYLKEVVGGPGWILVVAHSYEDFANAIRRKLVMEIASTR